MASRREKVWFKRRALRDLVALYSGPTILRRILYAASQDCFHNLPRARGNVRFERSPGAVSTHGPGVEAGKNGEVHGSAAGERLGTCSQLGRPLLGQRSRLRLVDTLHWQGSQGGLGGQIGRAHV